MAYSYRPEKRKERPITGYVLPTAGERRPRRMLHRRPILLVALIGLLIIAAGSLYMSPTFRVQEIQVIGTAGVDSELVREFAKLDGKSMFHLPLNETERRVASGLPLVKAAEAERNWPQSVQITLIERTIWGYWASGNIAYAIDQEGVVLEKNVSPIIGMPAHQRLGRQPFAGRRPSGHRQHNTCNPASRRSATANGTCCQQSRASRGIWSYRCDQRQLPGSVGRSPRLRIQAGRLESNGKHTGARGNVRSHPRPPVRRPPFFSLRGGSR